MAYTPLIQYVFLFVLGAAMGSFLNVLADRLSTNRSILGRSHCEFCHHTLEAADLIPLVSFLLLLGRCRYCQKPFSWQYFLLELLTAVMYVVSWMFLGNYGAEKVIYLGIISSLIVIFFADLRFQIIPDSMEVSLIVLTIALNIVQHPHFNIFTQVGNEIIAGLIVMAPILLLFLVTLGRGMGFGDVKLAFVIGFMFGIPLGLVSLYIGFILGGIAGIVLILLHQKKMKSKIAFGPFLVLGMISVLYLQNPITSLLSQWYPFPL